MIFKNETKKEKVLAYFFEHPTKEIHLRAIARQLRISPTGIHNILKKLIKEKLILAKQDNQTHLSLFKADIESAYFKGIKRSMNLYAILQTGLLNLLIEVYGKPEAIILFGSYARGEDREESDVDIAVITKKHIKIPLDEFNKKLSRVIKIIEFPHEKIEDEFLNTLANGIVLYGYLEVV